MTFWQFIFPQPQALLRRFFAEHYARDAASLAYATLLSIVPLMMVVFYVLSWIPQFHGIAPTLKTFLLAHFVASSAQTLAQYFDQFLAHRNSLALHNMVALWVISVLLIADMAEVFNKIWQVQARRLTHWHYLSYGAVLLVTPLLMAAVMVAWSYFLSLPWLDHTVAASALQHTIARGMPYLVEWVLFTFLNVALPNARVSIRCALWVGWVNMLLFECAKLGFVWYLHWVPTVRLVYGALATLPIFLIWLYCMWLIVLFCGLYCHAMVRSRQF